MLNLFAFGMLFCYITKHCPNFKKTYNLKISIPEQGIF